MTRLRSGTSRRKNYRSLAGLTKTRSTRRPRVARLSKPVRMAVKRIVKASSETKLVTTLVENNVPHNSAIGALDYYRVIPQITQGPAEYQRVGDKVQPVSLVVRGTCAIDRQYSTDNKPLMVRILILQLKSTKQWASVGSAFAPASQRLLKMNDEGGTENIQFQGSPNDLYYPVNRDLFTVLGERFIKLDKLPPSGASLGNSAEVAPINTIARSFNIKVRGVPKQLLYSQGTDNLPTNFAPFMSVGYCYLDGTGPDVVNTNIIMNAQAHLHFKDL